VLLPFLVVAVLYLVGFIAVAWIAGAAVKRLGLDPWKVLLWFGLAEAPVDETTSRRSAPAQPRLSAVS
jgi:hypothetical protein